jgi:RNA polymerase sigma factor (sigma-70 family)
LGNWANRRRANALRDLSGFPFLISYMEGAPRVEPEEPKLRSSAGLDLLLRNAQASDLDDTFAMNEITRRFEPLADRLARRATKNPTLQEDLQNAARLALVRAVRRHDLDRAGFPAYAQFYMRGAVNREHQRWLPSLPQEVQGLAPDPLSVEEGADVAQIVEERLAPWGDGDVATAMAGLSPTQRRIVAMRYIEDAPLERIAEVTGTSCSAVSQRIATVHRSIARRTQRPRRR